MYIAILNQNYGGNNHKEILGLYRELENAQNLIRSLADLMKQQFDFWEDPNSTKNCIDLEGGLNSLRYWILEKEVFEDEC